MEQMGNRQNAWKGRRNSMQRLSLFCYKNLFVIQLFQSSSKDIGSARASLAT